MRSKQNPIWVIVCVFVCIAVALTLLACLPAWDGMGDMSAFEAVVYTVKQWFAQ